MGLIQSGMTPILSVELDAQAALTYSKNFNHKCLVEDITKMSGDFLVHQAAARPDVIVGGPPCQGFSTVGKRDVADKRNDLVNHFIRIVSEIKPEYFIMENVLGLKDMKFIQHVEQSFENIGYSNSHYIFTSADYGVPQYRRRVVFIGSLNSGYFIQPKALYSKDNYISVIDAIGDLPEIFPGQEIINYDKPPMTDFQRLMRGDNIALQGHQASKHNERLIQAISFIEDGGNRTSIPEQYQPNSGFHNSYSRLSSKKPAVAITQNMSKPSGTRCIHPFQNRGLTPREGARLQSFPDKFFFYGTGTSQRLQIANAVPPLLASAIGSSIQNPSSWCMNKPLIKDNIDLNVELEFV